MPLIITREFTSGLLPLNHVIPLNHVTPLNHVILLRESLSSKYHMTFRLSVITPTIILKSRDSHPTIQ